MKSPLATRDEAAAYLRLSLRSFNRLAAPELDRVPIGARVFYRWKDLETWLDAQTVGAARAPAPATPLPTTGGKVVSLGGRRALAIATKLRRMRRDG